jgi:hypothetical protein
MIGTKKLSAIREEIETALAASGEDPIQRLERQTASAKRKGECTDVMEGLKRFLESAQSRNTPSVVLGQKVSEAVTSENAWCYVFLTSAPCAY